MSAKTRKLTVNYHQKLGTSVKSMCSQAQQLFATYQMNPAAFTEEMSEDMFVTMGNLWAVRSLIAVNKKHIALGQCVVVEGNPNPGYVMGFGQDPNGDSDEMKVAVSFTTPPHPENAVLYSIEEVQHYKTVADKVLN